MNSDLVLALEILKNNCKEHKDCRGCELFDIGNTCGCYLSDKTPEDFLEGCETNE